MKKSLNHFDKIKTKNEEKKNKAFHFSRLGIDWFGFFFFCAGQWLEIVCVYDCTCAVLIGCPRLSVTLIQLPTKTTNLPMFVCHHLLFIFGSLLFFYINFEEPGVPGHTNTAARKYVQCVLYNIHLMRGRIFSQGNSTIPHGSEKYDRLVSL